MATSHKLNRRPVPDEFGFAAFSLAISLALVSLVGCSYENGTTERKTTRTVESPTQKTTTTTKTERKVEDYPR